jgi:hypothetical protein
MHPARFATTAIGAVALLLGSSSTALAQSSGHAGDQGSANREQPFALAAAADVACTPGELGVPPNGTANGPDNCQQAQTASLIESLNPDAVASPGDIQYQFGTFDEFNGSFGPTWGAFKSKIYPAPGNHEWYDLPVNGAGYFDYFNGPGTVSGPVGVRGNGYYSVNLTRHWHLISLNSNCTSDNSRILAPVPCNPGSVQEQWLRSDLKQHRDMCTIAEWHHPLFTSGPNQGGPNDLATRSFWDDLYAAGATLVLNGHDHGYERFAPQTPSGAVDPTHGVREFVVGTGGKSLFGPGVHMAANSRLYDVTTFGVTLFTLYPHSYHWQFIREPVQGNGTLVDQGWGRCNTAA